MTAAQRLRLVLTLGVINLVLASVALTVGIVGVQSPPSTAGGPTPGIAFVSPAPTATSAPTEPTPAATPGPGTSTPGTPVPTTTPTAEPTPLAPGASPAAEPSPSPTVVPTPAPGATLPPVRTPTVVLGHPSLPGPTETPTPVAETPGTPAPCAARTGPTATRAAAQDCGKHAVKPARAKHDKKPHKDHKPKAHVPHHDGPQATVDKSNRGHKSGRRLRIRYRTR